MKRVTRINETDLKIYVFPLRSAIRSQAGIGIIEFLPPLLILDSTCFGENHVKDSSLTELRNALSVKTDQNKMPKAEQQKSITTVFMVIKTLKAWFDDKIWKNYAWIALQE